MDDDDIDYSDIPPLTDQFFESATLRIPASCAPQSVKIESDVLQWFQSQDEEYQSLINAVLRRYIETQSEQTMV